MARNTLKVQIELGPALQAEIDARVQLAIARATSSDTEGKVIGYGILVRHSGFIDRLLPEVQSTHYPIASIDHWVSGSREEPMRFQDEASAQKLADELTAKFGTDRYRFTVIVSRLRPAWFIARPDPKSPWETCRIGKYEQI